jgi:hypothetical protein
MYWRDQQRFLARAEDEIFWRMKKMTAPGRRRKEIEAAKMPFVRINRRKNAACMPRVLSR